MKLRLILSSTLLTLAIAAFGAVPKYIFYFIGDGMGPGPTMVAQTYNRTVLSNDDPLLMMQFPVVSQAFTYSANSTVTDSAAAGTALATGFKTKNSMLGMGPDSVAVESIAKKLQADGYGIGIITSVYPDDATPGAFYAHVPSRSMYYEIGRDAAASGFEFIGGSNLRGTTNPDGTPNDLIPTLEQAGYAVVRGVDNIPADASKVFLLSPFEDRISNIGYTIDSIAGAMTLPQMTQACLNHLERLSPNKFFMMVEGGNIDHAAHANDGGAVVKEVINFNQALKIAYDFYLAHPDETLIVVTADHDTGGMTLNKSLPNGMAYFDAQRMSKDEFSNQCKAMLRSRRIYTWEDMRDILSDKFGFWTVLPLSQQQTDSLKEKFEQTFEMRNSADEKTLYNSFNAFAVEVFHIIDSFTGVAWTTNSHTGNPVPVYAIGVDAQRFGNYNNNIDIPAKILSIVTGK